MSKEGKQDTHKLNDFSSRSFSSPPSSCLSGLILKIWLSIPKVLCCVFHSVGCGASETQMMWGWMEEVLRSEIWWSMIMGFLQQQQESQRDEERQKRIVDELFMMISCRLLLLGVHETFLHFHEWWTRSLIAQLRRSCREHSDRHKIFVISIPFFLIFDDKKLIEFFSSSESFFRCRTRWLNWKENEPFWVMENRSWGWFCLKRMSINQNEFL